MKNIIYDEVLIFGQDNTDALMEAFNVCNNPETFEDIFSIDLCFGEGYFSEDLNDDAEIMEKYDGVVSFTDPPRYRDTKKVFDVKRKYRFIITDPHDSIFTGDYVCYINGQRVNK